MKETSKLKKESSSKIQDMYFKEDGNIINIMDLEPDPKILLQAREYDRTHVKRKRNHWIATTKHVAMLLLICFVTVSALSLESSSALRSRVFHLFFEDEGSATFFGKDEYELIGEWTDYWHPNYLPEGFILKGADRSESEKIMLFTSKDGDEIRILERSLDAVLTIDTDSTALEEVRIKHYYGYLFSDKECDFMEIYWLTDDRQISIEMKGKTNKETLLKVAENLEYKTK